MIDTNAERSSATESIGFWHSPIPIESLAINTLSLRDYFAIHAPESCVPKATVGDIQEFKGKSGNDRWKPEYMIEWEAHHRYKYADAMMAARKQKGL